MKQRRAVVGGTIIAAWLAGLAVLVHREYYRPQIDRLSEAALRVAPGAVFFGVMQGGQQIGFASSTIDTSEASIMISDYFVADIPIGATSHRASARTNVTLSRALRMMKFTSQLDTNGTPISMSGLVDGDSVLILARGSGLARPDTQRIKLTGPIFLPTLVPIAVALGETPKVGKRYLLPLFDAASTTAKDVGVAVRAESVFVVDDSAVFDAATKRWHGVRPDTLHAWKVTAEAGGGFSGWIDEQGRVIQTSQLDFVLKRLPYEVAFENWRTDSLHLAVTADRGILETTAIAANKRPGRRLDSLTVRLSDIDLAGLALVGEGQRINRDTLTIVSEPDSALAAPYAFPAGRLRAPEMRPEPLIESDSHGIRELAGRIRGAERDRRVVAERINAWVHDSIADRVAFGVPSALRVLETRVGDCNEHTQLFVALARADGIPARVAAGLAYVDGKFYYHAWPEILLHSWVPVDPTFGQFPADAAHLRFVEGSLPPQAELIRLMGSLQISVLTVNGVPPAQR